MNAPQAVIALALDHPDGHVIPFHWHSRAQLLYASTGVMTVTTGSGVWVLPPLRAMWIPAFTEHSIRTSGHLSMRTLYLKPDAARNLPSACRIVSVCPLLRELIVFSTTLPRFYEPGSLAGRTMALIVDLLEFRDTVPLDLPIPRDPRLRKIFDLLSVQPADGRTVEDWGVRVGASGRTLSRLFRSETGMSFHQWRQQLRLLEATRLLGQGESVTNIALDVGYNSLSAFVSVFRRTLGVTPGRYFRGDSATPPAAE
ncbi:MAG TPA: helix-turn-helix transcriptional regulator [Syntrophales bacterium]|nr:helix-turn-helix transcriptional regulator [Syntrophales bacterium]